MSLAADFSLAMPDICPGLTYTCTSSIATDLCNASNLGVHTYDEKQGSFEHQSTTDTTAPSESHSVKITTEPTLSNSDCKTTFTRCYFDQNDIEVPVYED